MAARTSGDNRLMTRRQQFGQLVRSARADQGGGDRRLVQDEPQRQLGERQPRALGDRDQLFDCRVLPGPDDGVPVVEVVGLAGRPAGGIGDRSRSILAGQPAAVQRGPDQRGEPVPQERRHDLGLDAAGEDRVRRLLGARHRDAESGRGRRAPRRAAAAEKVEVPMARTLPSRTSSSSAPSVSATGVVGSGRCSW